MSVHERPASRSGRIPKMLVVAAAGASALLFFNVGLAGADQRARVRNNGVAVADTGQNTAFGNLSQNRARNDQAAVASGRRGESVAFNAGSASNVSDGRAEIDTGDATALNANTTTVAQTSDGSRNDQNARVRSNSAAVAGTGSNAAFGNLSENRARNNQAAISTGRRGGVAFNAGDALNASDGRADIRTGDAGAVNTNDTAVVQVSD